MVLDGQKLQQRFFVFLPKMFKFDSYTKSNVLIKSGEKITQGG